MADERSGYRGTRVRSPNNTGPMPQRPHPERDNAQDPRRPYDDAARKRQYAHRREDSGDTRQFAKDEVERHLREHRG